MFPRERRRFSILYVLYGVRNEQLLKRFQSHVRLLVLCHDTSRAGCVHLDQDAHKVRIIKSNLVPQGHQNDCVATFLKTFDSLYSVKYKRALKPCRVLALDHLSRPVWWRMNQHDVKTSRFELVFGRIAVRLKPLALLVDRDGQHVSRQVDVSGNLHSEGCQLKRLIIVLLSREVIFKFGDFDSCLPVIGRLKVYTCASKVLNICFKRDKENSIVSYSFGAELLAKLVSPLG